METNTIPLLWNTSMMVKRSLVFRAIRLFFQTIIVSNCLDLASFSNSWIAGRFSMVRPSYNHRPLDHV
ncbi:hypothetical protein PWO93_00265 [Lactiplantibacillus paraplantarum]|nr:hypothetical protein [Lactiplantibacillus paraplantarum]WEE36059.1 hypothetical protein PWO93_00265 [Lactiplantibacillus paraplantarum]